MPAADGKGLAGQGNVDRIFFQLLSHFQFLQFPRLFRDQFPGVVFKLVHLSAEILSFLDIQSRHQFHQILQRAFLPQIPGLGLVQLVHVFDAGQRLP